MFLERAAVVRLLSFAVLAIACLGLAAVLLPRPADTVAPNPIVVIVESPTSVRWVNAALRENADGTHQLIVDTSVDVGAEGQHVNMTLWVPGSGDSLVTCEPSPDSCTQSSNDGDDLGLSPKQTVRIAVPAIERSPSTLREAAARFTISSEWKPMACSKSKCAGYITTVVAGSGTKVAPDAPAVSSYEGSSLNEYEWTSPRMVPDAGNDVPTFMTPLPEWSYITTRVGTPFAGTIPGSAESDSVMTFVLGAVVGVGGGFLVAAIQELGSVRPKRQRKRRHNGLLARRFRKRSGTRPGVLRQSRRNRRRLIDVRDLR